jgi:ActR/RegA family two-component response regulator
VADTARKLLIVEDDRGLQKQLKWCFDGYDVLIAEDRDSALGELRRHDPPVVLQDLGLPPDAEGVSEGFKTLQEILQAAPRTKVIVVTGNENKDNALKAVGLGAYDFYQKPVDVDVLQLLVNRAFALWELEEENLRLAREQAVSPLAGVIAVSPQMQEVCRKVEKIAAVDVTTLLLGESGTGKEVFAKALHALSPRAEHPLRRHQLRRHSREPARERAVRPREGRVHRRAQADPGQGRDGRQGHAAARRDRRHAGAAAGQAAALPAGAHHRARRRPQGDPGGRARGVRHQPGPAGADRRRPLPRGPVLPHQRSHHQHPAAQGAQRAAAWCSRSTSCRRTRRP